MAVPKRKTSRSRTRSRRAHWTATPVQLVPSASTGRRSTCPGAWREPWSAV